MIVEAVAEYPDGDFSVTSSTAEEFRECAELKAHGLLRQRNGVGNKWSPTDAGVEKALAEQP